MRVLLASLLCVCGVVFAEEWIRLEPSDRPITVGANGVVVSAGALRFGPPASHNWNTSIMQLAREGSKVTAGDVLARFDDSTMDDRVRNKKAELSAKRLELVSLAETQSREIEETKVALAAAASAVEKANRKVEGSAKLYAGLEYQKLLEEKTIADELYGLERRSGKLIERVRESRRAELEADIRRLEIEVDVAQEKLETFAIRAPRDGLVIVGTNLQGQKLDINDVVNPGMIVVELAKDDDLVVWAEVPEYVAASLDSGQVARVQIDAVGGNVFEGTVISVARIVRRQSQYSQAMVRDVTVELPEEVISSLRPGMSAKLDIVVDTQKYALTVPSRSLVYRDGKPGVLVRGDGWRPVKLGRTSAGQHVIEAGIEPGDEVSM